MTKKPTVFISHASEDEHLGRAWMELIQSIPWANEVPFLAEDMRRGIATGDNWAASIDRALDDADVTIALLTPSSNNRPWILWESGVAYGRNKKFQPVYCYLDERKINPVLQQFQAREVMSKEGAAAVCKDLFPPPGELEDFERNVFEGALTRYERAVRKHKVIAETQGLFVDHFHNHDRAKKLDGYWLADWDVFDEDGALQPYERDELCLWTTDDRVRAVGYNTKTGIDRLGTIARFYPMEGLVSASGWIALSYWSAAEIQYCGAILLLDDGTGTAFDGTWEGYSAPELGGEAGLKKGVVRWRRILDPLVDPLSACLREADEPLAAAAAADAIGMEEEDARRLLDHLVIVDQAQKLDGDPPRWKWTGGD